jgi:hypothetical protein
MGGFILQSIKKSAFILFCLALSFVTLFCLWRYTPVRLPVQKIEKVVLPEATETGKADCARFTMTPQEFADYFAKVKRVFAAETEYYGFGGCYYKTTLENKTFVIWIFGVAEIWEDGDTAYYASRATAPMVPQGEAAPWYLSW